METTVEKLEAMFQKSEADLEYLEKRLKLDFVTKTTENGSPAEENPVALLENLVAIKARHASLCSQVKDLATAQQESMDSIRTNLNSTMQLIQRFQQTADVEVLPLMESEQEAAELLASAVNQQSAEVPPSIASSVQQQPLSHKISEFEDLNEAMLEAVPLSVRSNIKLADLNAFYQQLRQHFSSKNNSGSLSFQKMKQLNIKVSNAKLKTLQHLSLVELDQKGHVRLLI